MACGCEIKKMQSELDRISELAKKAAILDGCMYVVYQKEDGTYAFDKVGNEIKGKITNIDITYNYGRISNRRTCKGW